MQREARSLRVLRRLAALATACLVAACATPPRPAPEAGPQEAHCRELFARLDRAIDEARVRDAEAARIEGFPQLRVDRLLASFRHEAGQGEALRFWMDRLGELDAQAREAELANLPEAARTGLFGPHAATAGKTLAQCRALLSAADLAGPARIAALREAAVVPDDYSLLLRTLGLYPLTRLPFGIGVARFERKVAERFSMPLAALPVAGRIERWAPPAADASLRPDALIARAAANPLGIPYPDEKALHALALAHAPVLEIDTASRDDRIGTPSWPPQGPIRIDTERPQLFYRAAHTRVGERVLLQLVYTAWFPARTATGPFDLLAGHLDGLVWRVTLDEAGTPLVFDSIHPCGCYHFFFPTERVAERPTPSAHGEWRFIPQRLPAPRPGERAVLRVAARTHYLERVRFEADAGEAQGRRYALAPAGVLRSLPHPTAGRRSMFGPDGFVAGTTRGERFLFWPMGICSAGAMRQWGRHATAFIGRRHFDEARLLDERFRFSGDPATPPVGPAP